MSNIPFMSDITGDCTWWLTLHCQFYKGCLSSEVFPLSKKEVQLKLWKSYPNQWLSTSLNRGKSVNMEIWIIHKQQLCQDMDFNKNKNSNTSPNMYEEYNINMKNSNGSKWLKFQIVNMMDNSPYLSSYTKYLKQMGLTHCGLVTSYGSIHLGQHWARYACYHQAFTWTNADFSAGRSHGILLGGLS